MHTAFGTALMTPTLATGVSLIGLFRDRSTDAITADTVYGPTKIARFGLPDCRIIYYINTLLLS